ncbi:hypothetical protein [Mesorhizobium sp. CN2-181]|uniref:hypothetical protein n=1 Tax=Mesorhizobium yinganensis TaxID=3157707 RepID=UPI0032B87C87
MSKWYKAGFQDALDGLPFDPPWQVGHRDHKNYTEGFRDGVRQAERNVKAEEAVMRGKPDQ